MLIRFKAYGHPNVLATHKTTLEFTKENFLTANGDCIIGIRCDYNLDEIKKIDGKVRITLKVGELKDSIEGYINPGFSSDKCIVIRRSEFTDFRTLVIRSNKASIDLDRNLTERLKNSEQILNITIEDEKTA